METLRGLIAQLEAQPRWRSQGQFRVVLAHWHRTVGDRVAAQSEPVKISRGVLYVAVANPTWAQTLTFERLHILQKLNCHLKPPLTDLRFSAGDWWRRSPQRPRQAEAQLHDHPCYCPAAMTDPLVRADTALEAFQQWAQQRQQMAKHQPYCPRCHCPCPPGELQRWGCCSICAAQANFDR